MARVKLSVKALLVVGLFVIEGLTIQKGFIDGKPSFVIKGLRFPSASATRTKGLVTRKSPFQNIIAANIQTEVILRTCQHSPSAINRAINFPKPKILHSLNSPFATDILPVPPQISCTAAPLLHMEHPMLKSMLVRWVALGALDTHSDTRRQTPITVAAKPIFDIARTDHIIPRSAAPATAGTTEGTWLQGCSPALLGESELTPKVFLRVRSGPQAAFASTDP
ncbi:hypothetical protein V498_04067 [Pseudogymnoascus sp. VKM F-4517 (FW-2822)]|nr:hypothetical protein V498_04067 [Pseudogymnoascus sp. VKM F-4517 (FW-2822)]